MKKISMWKNRDIGAKLTIIARSRYSEQERWIPAESRENRIARPRRTRQCDCLTYSGG